MQEKIQRKFDEAMRAYKSIPFWSWNNYLDEEELCRQIEEMRSAGVGGFIMHARTGLKEEYLGEKWFSCIGACLKKAKELQMDAWIYDDNGWPSGFVGGKLLKNENWRARFLEYKIGEFDDTAFVSYVKTVNGYMRVDKKLIAVSEYHNIYLRVSPANTDILNPEVVDEFIRETYDKYYERFGDSFGRELVGFFTDEPQYYRVATPYTPCLEPYFDEKKNELKDGLIWLFVQSEEGYAFRYKYYKILNELYCENYYKKIYEWCEKHNCKLTGHSVEENRLHTQMWGGAGVMPSYEYEQIPAIDCLGNECDDEIPSKQVSSVASQLGKKYVLTETFGSAGYDVNPKRLKSIAETQYFNGINKMCHHLYPYTIAGCGKIDNPPVFSKHSNWFEEFKDFNEYFDRLGCIIGETKETYDVGVIHPMRSVWLNYIRSQDEKSVQTLDDAFLELITYLRKNGIRFQLLDERLLERYGRVEGQSLWLGECEYKTLILPKMDCIAKSTYSLLKKYKGKLLLQNEIPCIDGEFVQADLQSNITWAQIVDSAQVYFRCEDGNCFMTTRKGEIGDFIFVKNLSSKQSGKIEFENVSQHYQAIDLQTLRLRNISNSITVPPNESLILIKSEEAEEEMVTYTETDVSSAFSTTTVSPNYFVMDYAQIRRADGVWGRKRPIQDIFEELLRQRHEGTVAIKQTFKLAEKMPLTLIMERANLLSAQINGRDIEFQPCDFDINFVQSRVDDIVLEGINEFIYTFRFYQHEGVHFALFDPLATESVRNCLYFDTSIEPIYLKGDFVVHADKSLHIRNKMPPLTSNLYKKGYPFFKGQVELRGEIDFQRDKNTYLKLNGYFLVANAFINGQNVRMVLDNVVEITPYLKQGKNDIKLIVKSSLRNLFGPHHYNNEEHATNVWPGKFDFRTQWQGKELPQFYTHQHISVPFGIDSVCILTRN